MLTGFKLEFSDGTTFRQSEEIEITHSTEPLFLLDGASNLVTLYNQYIDSGGTPGRADSNYSGVYLGFGAGVHTIELSIFSYEDDTESWGSVSSTAGPVTRLQELNRAITTKRADSATPAILSVGEYSSSGAYDPIPVAIGQTNLPFDPREQASSFRGQITFFDAIDVTNAVSSAVRGQ